MYSPGIWCGDMPTIPYQWRFALITIIRWLPNLAIGSGVLPGSSGNTTTPPGTGVVGGKEALKALIENAVNETSKRARIANRSSSKRI